MRVVKSFVREEYEKKKFEAAAEDVCADFTRAEKILAFNNPLMQFSLYAVMVFVLSFGSYTIITSRGLDLDVGQFSALLTYSFQILSSLMMLSMVFVHDHAERLESARAHCGSANGKERAGRARKEAAENGRWQMEAWNLKMSASNTPAGQSAWPFPTSI